MATVTENWSDRRFKRGENGARGFMVTDVANEDEAIQAVADYGADVDDPFPLDNRLRAEEPDCKREHGPLCFKVSVSYIVPEQGSITPNPPNPLDEPIKWGWGSGSFTEPSDIDAAGNPIVNTAYFPLEGAGSREVRYKILTGTRNQSTFDVPLAIAFENYVNNANVTIPMAGTVEPGQLYCASILPTHDFDINSQYVNVRYEFHLWKGRKKDADGLWDSWKHRLANTGRMGWWFDGAINHPAEFVGKNCSPLSEAVRLDKDGKPIETSFKVLKSQGVAAAAAAVAVRYAISANLIETTDNQLFLKYYKCLSRDFSGLSLF
jgi:hypothetical protein